MQKEVMTAEALRADCAKRYFDRITLVCGELESYLRDLERLYGLQFAEIRQEAGTYEAAEEKHPFRARTARCFLGGLELLAVEPVSGETPYKQYLERYGKGLCCVRERLTDGQTEAFRAHCREQKLRVIRSDWGNGESSMILDLTEQAGILFEATEDSGARAAAAGRQICQINITTDDVNRTVAALARLLRIGPWEIGAVNNRTTTEPRLLVDGKLTEPEFEFLLGITLCGNLEFEVIQPVKGPTVYRDFVQRKGTKFHHIKEIIPAAQWEETLKRFDARGIPRAIQGKIGPCSWVYYDTEPELGFLIELGDDVPMTQLPEGYKPYYYPEI